MTTLTTALQAFVTPTVNFREAALNFFKLLGYHSERSLPPCSVADFCEQFDSQNKYLNHATALKNDWVNVDLLFQLTDEELSNNSNAALFKAKDKTVLPSRASSYIFLAIQLNTGTKSKPREYSRSELAGITRRLNRVFPMPVMVLYQMSETISMAIINRRMNKLDEDKDVLGKVTLIHQINLNTPHRGHLDIIQSFTTHELVKTHAAPINSFDALHAAWETVFNVELLNKRFYEELANWYFWARGQVSFPSDVEADAETRNATSVIRLLTRLIFVWFLKEKHLIPDTLFNAEYLNQYLKNWQPAQTDDGTYYRAILQNLFFATLNQEMSVDNPQGKPSLRQFASSEHFLSNRTQHGIKNLYRYEECFHSSTQALKLFEDIPFLNGGLFACLDIEDNTGKLQYADGFSRNANKQAHIPNHLFFAAPHTVDLSKVYDDKKKSKASVRGLIHILQGYKFTIAESTPVEQEIALDPELLGNVFENLLASYNPETGQSARKQTGSFYTPRPIVDYMVDEALKAYLSQALCAALPAVSVADATVGLASLFAYTDKEHPFNAEETTALITAIDRCNILDPACGSGAYPMGILHKLVFILSKLDPKNIRWQQRQIDKAYDIEDVQARDSAVRAIQNDFESNNLDYGRKLYLIENCIYGVDIQPIAIQIAKLRFFISLICDQKTTTDKTRNLGVRPLPNLEIKFIAANTLIGLNDSENAGRSLFEDAAVLTLEAQLEKVRHRYFSAQTRQDKIALREKDHALRQKIMAYLTENDFGNAQSLRRVAWNPYDHASVAEFFDTATMFGATLKAGFDVVIGNPPYVQIQKFPAAQKAAWVQQNFKTYSASADIYCLFYERGAQLLKAGGQLCYITSNKWMRAGYGELLRRYFATQTTVQSVVDFSGISIFSAAVVDTNITHLTKALPLETHQPQAVMVSSRYRDFANLGDYVHSHATPLSTPKDGKNGWVVMSAERAAIKAAVSAQGIKLADWNLRINRGILTGFNEAFYLSDSQRAALIAADPKSAKLIVPLLRGRSVNKYGTDWAGLAADDAKWLIGTYPSLDLSEKDLPKPIAAHLNQFRTQLEPKPKKYTGNTWQGRKTGAYQWFETQDAIAYKDDFTQPKIIYPNMTKYLPFYYDENEHFYTNDKAFIIISEIENLPALTAQLNSTLFRACFKNNFPELLGETYEIRKVFFDQIPLKRPDATQANTLAGLVLRVQAAKKATPETAQIHQTLLIEQWLDACVMQLYFPDEMTRCGLDFFTSAENLLKTCGDVRSLYAAAHETLSPQLASLADKSPNVFGVILGG